MHIRQHKLAQDALAGMSANRFEIYPKLKGICVCLLDDVSDNINLEWGKIWQVNEFSQTFQFSQMFQFSQTYQYFSVHMHCVEQHHQLELTNVFPAVVTCKTESMDMNAQPLTLTKQYDKKASIGRLQPCTSLVCSEHHNHSAIVAVTSAMVK